MMKDAAVQEIMITSDFHHTYRLLKKQGKQD